MRLFEHADAVCPIKNSTFNQALCTRQEIHLRFLSIQSLAFDPTHGYASDEVCQILECFDVRARFLQQRTAGHNPQMSLGGLPALIISGTPYVAVLQAILKATVPPISRMRRVVQQ